MAYLTQAKRDEIASKHKSTLPSQSIPTLIDEIANAIAAHQAAAVTDLNQTISGTPTQAEVQAISDKVDELLAALRTAGLLAP
jgi:hypothetical protein